MTFQSRTVLAVILLSFLPLLMEEAVRRTESSRDETIIPDFCDAPSKAGLGVCGRLFNTTLSVYAHGKSLHRFAMDEGGLSRSQLEAMDLADVKLNNAFVAGSKIMDSTWTSCDWNGVVVSNSWLVKSRFDSCRWNGVLFDQVQARHSSFRFTQVKSTRFVLSDLGRADLRDADFSTSSFFLTNLAGARFNAATKLPFSREAALQRGMVDDTSVP